MKILEITARARVVNPPSSLLDKCSIPVFNEYNNKQENISMCKHIHNNEYLLPRNFFQGHGKLTDLKWKKLKFKTNFKLRDFQKYIVEEFKSYYKPLEIFGGIISAKTGSGKTVMALEIARLIGHKTLIIVPTTYLMTQWIDRIVTFTNIPKDRIGILQGSNADNYKDKDIVIGMLKSLATIDYEKDLYNYFGLTIYDEVHRIGSKLFSEVVYKFNDKFRLGLSATPRRKDKTDIIFLSNIGEIFTNTKTKYQSLKVYTVGMKIPFNSMIENECLSFRGDFLLQRYITLLLNNKKRTYMIVKYLIKAYEQDRNILVLSDRIALLENIAEKLKEEGIDNIGFLIGKKKEIDKKILLGTYQVAGLGVDIPDLDTLFLITPRTDIEQAIGRITRGNLHTNPIVVDFVEENVPVIERYWFKRFKFYKSMNADIHYKEV